MPLSLNLYCYPRRTSYSFGHSLEIIKFSRQGVKTQRKIMETKRLFGFLKDKF